LVLSNVWNKHFNLLVIAVVVVGLVAGAGAAAALTKPAPAVIAQSTGTQGGSGNQSSASAQRGTGGAGGSAQGAAAGQTGAAAATLGTTAGQSSSGNTSRPVFGSVASVDANTATITGQQGDVKVSLSGVKVTKTVDGTAADLTAGERVTVVGQQQADGSYTATTVQIVPADQAQRGGANAQGSAPQASNSGQTGSAAQGNGGSRAQGQQGSGTGARPLAGTVKSVDNGVLTLTTQQGDEKVNLAGAKVEKTVDGTTKDLQTGQQVVVTGQPGTDGSYSSSQIQILPAGSTAPTARGSQSSSGQPATAPAAAGR
jgi:hypothetical protein